MIKNKKSKENKRKKKTKKRKISMVALYLIIVLVMYGVIYVIPRVTGFLDLSYPAEYGELKTEDQSTGYIIRNEKVYRTAHEGTVNRLHKEGQLVRKGSTIVEVSPSDNDFEMNERQHEIVKQLGKSAPKISDYSVGEGGKVSFYADGMENRLNPDNAFDLKKSFYSKLSQEDVIKIGKGKVAKGEPVFKIYDQTGWYILTYVKKSHLNRYQDGAYVQAVIDGDEENPVRFKVVKTGKEGEKGKVLLGTDNDYSRMGELRSCELTVITANARGLVIEKGSLTEKKGQKGVYIKNKHGKPVFKPVKVYAVSGDRAVIADSYYIDSEGTRITSVNPYEDVFKKPKK